MRKNLTVNREQLEALEKKLNRPLAPSGEKRNKIDIEALRKPPKKPSQRKRKPVTTEGTFDSKMELVRWAELRLARDAGHITQLCRQVRYRFEKGLVLIGGYTIDFQYVQNGKIVVEDYKGRETIPWRRQKRNFEAYYPDYELRITKRADLVLTWNVVKRQVIGWKE